MFRRTDISQPFADLHDATTDLCATAVPDAGTQRVPHGGRSRPQADHLQEDFRRQAFRLRRINAQQNHLAVSHG